MGLKDLIGYFKESFSISYSFPNSGSEVLIRRFRGDTELTPVYATVFSPDKVKLIEDYQNKKK